MPHIYALFPQRDLWHKPFADWTDEDWTSQKHLSILWNIETGRVHYAFGIQSADNTRLSPQTFDQPPK